MERSSNGKNLKGMSSSTDNENWSFPSSFPETEEEFSDYNLANLLIMLSKSNPTSQGAAFNIQGTSGQSSHEGAVRDIGQGSATEHQYQEENQRKQALVEAQENQQYYQFKGNERCQGMTSNMAGPFQPTVSEDNQTKHLIENVPGACAIPGSSRGTLALDDRARNQSYNFSMTENVHQPKEHEVHQRQSIPHHAQAGILQQPSTKPIKYFRPFLDEETEEESQDVHHPDPVTVQPELAQQQVMANEQSSVDNNSTVPSHLQRPIEIPSQSDSDQEPCSSQDGATRNTQQNDGQESTLTEVQHLKNQLELQIKQNLFSYYEMFATQVDTSEIHNQVLQQQCSLNRKIIELLQSNLTPELNLLHTLTTQQFQPSLQTQHHLEHLRMQFDYYEQIFVNKSHPELSQESRQNLFPPDLQQYIHAHYPLVVFNFYKQMIRNYAITISIINQQQTIESLVRCTAGGRNRNPQMDSQQQLTTSQQQPTTSQQQPTTSQQQPTTSQQQPTTSNSAQNRSQKKIVWNELFNADLDRKFVKSSLFLNAEFSKFHETRAHQAAELAKKYGIDSFVFSKLYSIMHCMKWQSLSFLDKVNRDDGSPLIAGSSQEPVNLSTKKNEMGNEGNRMNVMSSLQQMLLRNTRTQSQSVEEAIAGPSGLQVCDKRHPEHIPTIPAKKPRAGRGRRGSNIQKGSYFDPQLFYKTGRSRTQKSAFTPVPKSRKISPNVDTLPTNYLKRLLESKKSLNQQGIQQEGYHQLPQPPAAAAALPPIDCIFQGHRGSWSQLQHPGQMETLNRPVMNRSFEGQAGPSREWSASLPEATPGRAGVYWELPPHARYGQF